MRNELSSKKRFGTALVAALLALATPFAAAGQEPAVGAPVTPPPAQDPEAAKVRGGGIPLDVSGYFWVDSGYLERRNDRAANPDTNSAYMTGHFVLGGAYRRSFDDLNAEAKVELVGILNEYRFVQDVRPILDAYLKVGQKRWDVQVGRFLGWEVYQRGQGIELYTAEEAGALGAPKMYLLDYSRGHLNGPGQAALHLYPTSFLGIELAGIYGMENEHNFTGVRPVVDVRFGGLQLVGGYEWVKELAQKAGDKYEATKYGYAGRVQYTLALATLGVDYGRSNVELIDLQGLRDTSVSGDTTSLGAFLDLDFWKNSIGLGYHRTTFENERGEEPYQDQAFVSYLYRLPVEGLSVKAVYGLAWGHLETIDGGGSEWENDLQSFRLRVAYEFE